MGRIWKKTGSSKAIVAFTSHYDIEKTNGVHRYEWIPTVSRFHADAMYVRDETMSWYLKGISGLGQTFEESITTMALELDEYDSVLLVGGSMGAFAALLYGHFLAVKGLNVSVKAFAPQTNLTQELSGMNGWMDNKIKTNVVPLNDDRFLKLKDVMFRLSTLDAHVYFSRDREYDVKSAKELDGVACLHPIDGKDHNVAGVLAKRRQLLPIIDEWVK